MQVTKAEALCQEFCDSVSAVVRLAEDEGGADMSSLEIKCQLDRKFFSELLSRMAKIGYCCGQVQKDSTAGKCVAWFEEATDER